MKKQNMSCKKLPIILRSNELVEDHITSHVPAYKLRMCGTGVGVEECHTTLNLAQEFLPKSSPK